MIKMQDTTFLQLFDGRISMVTGAAGQGKTCKMLTEAYQMSEYGYNTMYVSTELSESMIDNMFVHLNCTNHKAHRIYVGHNSTVDALIDRVDAYMQNVGENLEVLMIDPVNLLAPPPTTQSNTLSLNNKLPDFSTTLHQTIVRDNLDILHKHAKNTGISIVLGMQGHQGHYSNRNTGLTFSVSK